MTYDAAVLVPPPPLAPLGAMAVAALLAERGRTVALLEAPGADDPARPEEPFLIPVPADGRRAGPEGLLPLLATATRLPPLDRILDRPAVSCQLILEHHRLDLGSDAASLALEVAREWPDAGPGLAALDRQLGDLDAAVAAAPPRLLVGAPTGLGRAGDLIALVRRPRPWLRGQAALAAGLPEIGDPRARDGLALLGVALGGARGHQARAADLWRAWAAARRGGRPPAGAPGVVGHLRARALQAGATVVRCEADALEVSGVSGGVAVRAASGSDALEAGLLVSGWPAVGLAPRLGGRLGERLSRLAARTRPVRWPARLSLQAPADCLPVGLAARAVIGGEPGPLLLEVTPAGSREVRLRATALLDRPAAEPGLIEALRRRLEWLIPFLPAGAAAAVVPPDPRWPMRFETEGSRPLAVPPLAARGIALVGPDVAPALGPEGEVLAALIVVGALVPATA